MLDDLAGKRSSASASRSCASARARPGRCSPVWWACPRPGSTLAGEKGQPGKAGASPGSGKPTSGSGRAIRPQAGYKGQPVHGEMARIHLANERPQRAKPLPLKPSHRRSATCRWLRSDDTGHGFWPHLVTEDGRRSSPVNVSGSRGALPRPGPLVRPMAPSMALVPGTFPPSQLPQSSRTRSS